MEKTRRAGTVALLTLGAFMMGSGAYQQGRYIAKEKNQLKNPAVSRLYEIESEINNIKYELDSTHPYGNKTLEDSARGHKASLERKLDNLMNQGNNREEFRRFKNYRKNTAIWSFGVMLPGAIPVGIGIGMLMKKRRQKNPDEVPA